MGKNPINTWGPFIVRLFNLQHPRAGYNLHGRFRQRLCIYSHGFTTTSENFKQERKQRSEGEWLELAPYKATIDGSALGKELSELSSSTKLSKPVATATTAVKWVIRCCPELPRSLIQKLFRLRQVRKEAVSVRNDACGGNSHQRKLTRVAAKDVMNSGDRLLLPITVKQAPQEERGYSCSEEEIKFIQSLVLYKDSAIIVVNKPPGMPVQGGCGISRSLDEIAATCLSYEYKETPRLVHRLDRDSSGILVMGRTQTSATILHSIFREKTFNASVDIQGKMRALLKRYLALVIGYPRRPKGLITAALGKVVMDNGKSDRITAVGNSQNLASQYAITEYRVIGSSPLGLTWLELCPLTGRKHQLRVHCAEVLGTPIVGDYKYGWLAHKNWKQTPWPNLEEKPKKELSQGEALPFGVNLEMGSISEDHPRLHLHCKQMTLPNLSLAMENLQPSFTCNLSEVPTLQLVAPLPSYMQRSWDTTIS